jgi:translocation and assembly module TamB
MKLVRRLLRYGAIGLVAVVALALGAAAVFTLTERGRSNLASIVSTAISGEGTRIEVSGIDGVWTGRLRASEVVVADAKGPWLALRGVAVDWSPLALLGFTFEAERIHADRIEVARLPVASGESGGGGFSLPVAIDVKAVDLPEILLGGQLAGRVASISAQGSVRISGDPVAAQARLSLARTDGTQGALSVNAAYLPQDNRIDLDVEGEEPAGGIIAALLRLPGEPAVAIRASGSGPASDWAGKAEFAVDGTVVTRLSGRHQLTDGGSRVELSGQGAFASFLPASLAPLAAGDTQIEFAGTLGAGGRVAVDNARLASAAIEATASGTVDPAGRSDFRLSARATETAPRLVFGSGAAQATVELGEAELALSGEPGALTVEARAAVPYAGLPDHEAEEIALTLASGNFDIAAMTGTLAADISAMAAGSTNETLAGLLAGGLSGTITAAVDAGAITFETTSLKTGTAAVNANGRWSRADGALAVDIAAQARSVVLPAAARPLLDETVILKGRIERSADGALALRGLDVSSSALAATGEATLAGGAVEARLSGSIADLSRLSTQASGVSSFSLSASGELARPTISVEAGSERMSVAGRAIDGLSLTARLVADPAAPSGEFALSGRVGEEELMGGGLLTAVQGGGGDVRNLAIKLGANSLEGALSLDRALRPSGTITFSLPDLAPLAALALAQAEGAARGSVRLEVVDGKPVATLDALVDHLAAGPVQAGEVRVNAKAENYLVAPTVAGAASAGRIITGGTELREITLSLAQDAGWTRFDGRMNADGIPVAAAGRVQYSGGIATVELSSAEASPRGIAARLAAPSTLVWRNGALRLDGLTVAAAGGRASATGTLGSTLSLDLRLASLPAAALNAFAPGLDASGTITGSARVSGSASAPSVVFDASVSGGAIAQTRAAGFGAMDVTASGTYAGSSVRFEARVGDGSGLGMNGGGAVNIAARSATLDFSGRVPFGFLTRRLAAQGVALDGGADVSIAVRGNLFSPDISGSIRTIGARFVHAASGIAVDDLVADIALGGGAARINSLTGRLSSGGSVTGSGSVGISAAEGFPADLTLAVSGGRYADGRTVTASFGGEIKVTGPLTGSPLLSGQVDLGRTVITVPDRLPGSLATLDVQHRNASAAVRRQDEALRPATAGGGGGGLTLDLNVSAPQQIFIVGRGLDVELGGSLRLTGALAAPQAVGRFTLRRGRLALLGRRLDFSSGTVGFSGSLVPYLDLAASTQAEGATVTVSVSGPATDPAFAFTSTPSLPEDEVMARLIFGKAMGSLSPVQIAQLAAAVGQLAGIGGSTSFLERLRERIGVDDIDVRTDDETGDTSVAVGKYLNDRTYLTLEKGSQPGSGKATIDLDVGGGVKLRGEANDAGQTRGGIFYEREY